MSRRQGDIINDSTRATKANISQTVDNINNWITENNVNNQISQMATVIRTHKPGLDNISEIFKSTNEQTIINVTRAYKILNQLIAVGNFSDDELDMSKVLQYSTSISSNGFTTILQQSINKLKYQGINKNKLHKLSETFTQGSNLMDIMSYGQRAIMIPEFKPNGGNGYKQSKSYFDHRAVCNFHMFKLLEQGRAIIVPKDILPTEILKQTHCSKLELVQASKIEGRCCLNAGSKCRKYLSLNDGTDREECLKYYPKEQLPTIVDICELAEMKRSQIELLGELVVGATIDVADAYRQYTLSPEAAMQRAVIIYLGDLQIPHVVYPLVGWFGDAIAGDVYNVVGRFISWHHNNYENLNHTELEQSVNSDRNKTIYKYKSGDDKRYYVIPSATSNDSISDKLKSMISNRDSEPGIVVGSQSDVSGAISGEILDNIFTRMKSTDLNPLGCPDDLSIVTTAELHNSISSKFNTASAELRNDQSLPKCENGSLRTTTNFEYKGENNSLNTIVNIESKCENSSLRTNIKSLTYIDDGIIIDSNRSIESSRNQYREGVIKTFGPKSISDDKDKYWGQDLEAIGWQLNTRYEVWRVAPKQKGLNKIYASLFIRLPMDFCDEDKSIFVTRKILLEIASLLSWYAVVFRVGNSFVRSIFKNVGYGDEYQKVEISLNCKRDIAWWRLKRRR